MKTIDIKSQLFTTVVTGILFMGLACSDRVEQHQNIAQQTQGIIDNLIELRRDFHQYPELAGYEKRTAAVITEYLTNLGLEVKTEVAGNGVVGILKGKKEGKKIAWRADMDGIPLWFPEQVAYKSKIKGVQHGCGHDVHMAIGLGIAEVLSKNKELINGTVYFFFQPEEETFVGAKNMVQSKLYDSLDIDEIYALHVTALPVGQIMVKPNELYAYQKILEIKFKGEMSKADAEELHKKLRDETLRKEEASSPWLIPKAFDTLVGIRNPNTIFKDYLFIDEGFSLQKEDNQLNIIVSAYETNDANLPGLLPRIERIIHRSEFKEKYISASYIQENPTVINDGPLTEVAIQTLTDIYGDKAVIRSHGQIPHFNDDFIYFQQKTPGVYFLLGGSNHKKGITAMNHGPNFDVDEACINVGVKSFSSLILERVNSK